MKLKKATLDTPSRENLNAALQTGLNLASAGKQQPTETATYKRYQAKNAEQLRVANPNIHAFFEKFKGYRGGMVMNGAVAIQ